LSLDGQYQSSVNAITTIITEKSGENGSPIPEYMGIRVTVVDGEPLNGSAHFPNNVFMSYDVSGLPDGLYVDNGFLLGTMSVTEASVIRMDIPVTHVDGSQTTVPLIIIALPKGITGQEPDLNQEVAIELALPYNCGPGNCGGQCTSPQYCVLCPGEKANYCICSQSNCP